MTGDDVAEWVRSMKPELKVVLTSGYSDMPLAASEAVSTIKVLASPTRGSSSLAHSAKHSTADCFRIAQPTYWYTTTSIVVM